jgi:ParB-like chromosome segregation protein Spo0J
MSAARFPEQGVHLKVHPVAAAFPMLEEAELADLAASIKAEGLHDPIVRDTEGTLLDGRNRLAACELAGIEPRHTTYRGDDPVTLIMSLNTRRRMLSQGQRAIIVAKVRSETEHPIRQDAALFGVSTARISTATTVLEYGADLAEQVIYGTLGLDAAYAIARQRKAEAQALQTQLDELHAEAPDLAEQVTQGDLTLPQALAEQQHQREQAHRRERVEAIDTLRTSEGGPGPTFTERAERGHLDWQHACAEAEQWLAERKRGILHAQESLCAIQARWGSILILNTSPDSYLTDILDGVSEGARAFVQELAAYEATRSAATPPH